MSKKTRTFNGKKYTLVVIQGKEMKPVGKGMADSIIKKVKEATIIGYPFYKNARKVKVSDGWLVYGR